MRSTQTAITRRGNIMQAHLESKCARQRGKTLQKTTQTQLPPQKGGGLGSNTRQGWYWTGVPLCSGSRQPIHTASFNVGVGKRQLGRYCAGRGNCGVAQELSNWEGSIGTRAW